MNRICKVVAYEKGTRCASISCIICVFCKFCDKVLHETHPYVCEFKRAMFYDFVSEIDKRLFFLTLKKGCSLSAIDIS